jgi:AcrR family transcriptional regulator
MSAVAPQRVSLLMAAKRVTPAPVNSRRAEILRAAAQIFRDRGFDGTSVSDLARSLEMTKAGLYHYFTSKEALLSEIMMFGLERVRDEVLVPVREIRDPEARLRQLIVRHARIVTRGQGAVTIISEETRALPPAARRKIHDRMRVYISLIRETLAELARDGKLRDVDLTVATYSLIGMILWLPRWFKAGGRLTAEEAADEIAKVAFGGLLRSEPAAGRGPARRQPRSGARSRVDT